MVLLVAVIPNVSPAVILIALPQMSMSFVPFALIDTLPAAALIFIVLLEDAISIAP